MWSPTCTMLLNPNIHVFYGGRKPEHPDETHTNTGRTCKLHTERTVPRFEPTTFLLWGNSANHWATVPPKSCVSTSAQVMYHCSVLPYTVDFTVPCAEHFGSLRFGILLDKTEYPVENTSWGTTCRSEGSLKWPQQQTATDFHTSLFLKQCEFVSWPIPAIQSFTVLYNFNLKDSRNNCLINDALGTVAGSIDGR